MTVKDEVAHKHFCGGPRPTTNGWLIVPGCDDLPIFLLPPIFHLSTYSTYLLGALAIAAKYNYRLLCLIFITPFPNAPFAILAARKAMMPVPVAIQPPPR